MTRSAQAPAVADVSSPERNRAAPPTLERLASRRERVSVDRVDAGLWARGANYKMRFERGTATFMPFLASFAPHNFAIEFSLRQVFVGSDGLPFDAHAEAQLSARTVTFDRGPVRELYELAPRSVEQMFVFDSLPARDAISVQLDIASDLDTRVEAGELIFSNPFGRAVYSRAKALDASGRELELESSFIDGVLEIRVPAEFVRRATLPLTIDPILASFGVEASPVDALSPDVTFDATGAAVLYCWEEIFSANDHDIWADVYDPAGNPLYAGDWLDMTATYWGRPRSANVAASNRFLVVAHTVNNTTGRVEVWGRTRSVTSALLSPQFKIIGNSGYDVMFPDVGGDPFLTGPSFFCVVYERVYTSNVDHDLNAKLVSDGGTLATGAFGVDTSINTLDTDVSISKSNGSGTWNVAWQRRSPAGGNDIFGARIDWDGVIAAPTFGIAVGPADHTFPAVSSSAENSNLWLCVFEEDFGSDHDIIATGLDGATVKRTLDLNTYDGAFLYQDQRFPSVDCDGVHFACAYSELYSTSPTDYDVYVAGILFNGTSMSVLESHQPVFQTDGAEIEVQIVARESSQPSQSSQDYVLAWHREPDFYAFTSDDILGATYTGHAGGQVASFCDGATVVCPCGNGSSNAGGCPNSAHASGATLTWSGEPSTTADSLQFFVGGLPNNVTCLFFQGLNALNGVQGAVFGDGVRCVGSPMRRLGLVSSSPAGGALFPAPGGQTLSVKGQIAPGGATMIYQAWYRNPAQFCTASTTNLTNALVVAWTP